MSDIERKNDNGEFVSGIFVLAHRSVAEAVDSILSEDGQVRHEFAVSLGPEMTIRAINDNSFMAILRNATFVFADGIGTVWALRRKGCRDAVRVPGCEVWEELMKKAGRFQIPVFIVGANLTVIEKANQKLHDLYGVNVVGMQDGYFSESQEVDLIYRIRDSGARIVSVAMGSPRQEIFINRCRQIYSDAFFLGVGGTYDVFTGNVIRAPAWARKLNIEWLYRLFQQPTRIHRQLVLIKYLWLMVLRKI